MAFYVVRYCWLAGVAVIATRAFLYVRGFEWPQIDADVYFYPYMTEIGWGARRFPPAFQTGFVLFPVALVISGIIGMLRLPGVSAYPTIRLAVCVWLGSFTAHFTFPGFGSEAPEYMEWFFGLLRYSLVHAPAFAVPIAITWYAEMLHQDAQFEEMSLLTGDAAGTTVDLGAG